jgi:hypothetical protein
MKITTFIVLHLLTSLVLPRGCCEGSGVQSVTDEKFFFSRQGGFCLLHLAVILVCVNCMELVLLDFTGNMV